MLLIFHVHLLLNVKTKVSPDSISPGFSMKVSPSASGSSSLVYGGRYGESTGLFDTGKGHTYDGAPGVQAPSSHSIAALRPQNFQCERPLNKLHTRTHSSFREKKFEQEYFRIRLQSCCFVTGIFQR